MSEVANTPAPPPTRRSHGLHTVAIVGPPNSGKSTLFNQLTGLRQKVANYPGVTVEQRTGRMRLAHNREIDLIDLPGVYSLEPRSEDERVTRDVLIGRMEDTPDNEAFLDMLGNNGRNGEDYVYDHGI